LKRQLVKTMKKPSMVLEDIEARRLEQGIDDVSLRSAISLLRRGDHVKLTLVTGPLSYETLQVCITTTGNHQFRGKVTSILPAKCPVNLKVGASISFQAIHIHSVVKAA
jgi:hypothetical protein